MQTTITHYNKVGWYDLFRIGFDVDLTLGFLILRFDLGRWVLVISFDD